MIQLNILFILVLASANASKYFRPEQFQQDPTTREKYQNVLGLALDEDRLLPKLASGDELSKWESPPDPKLLLLSDLDTLENFLQDDPNDYRIKRTKTSLSIDNPLDVLRQQYFRAVARRLKYQSIEKNREHLLKTGKRSLKSSSLEFPSTSQKEFSENGLDESVRHSLSNNDQNPTTRRYQNRLDDLSYQT